MFKHVLTLSFFGSGEPVGGGGCGVLLCCFVLLCPLCCNFDVGEQRTPLTRIWRISASSRGVNLQWDLFFISWGSVARWILGSSELRTPPSRGVRSRATDPQKMKNGSRCKLTPPIRRDSPKCRSVGSAARWNPDSGELRTPTGWGSVARRNQRYSTTITTQHSVPPHSPAPSGSPNQKISELGHV